MSRLLIVTDAWYPQINGVVRSLDQTARSLRKLGMEVVFLTPLDFKTIPMPGYKEIPLTRVSRSQVRKAIEELEIDSLHIATEGPLGWAARNLAVRMGWQFTTSLHTKFPEYMNKRTWMPVSWGYSILRRFHSKANTTLVTTVTQQQELIEHGITNTQVWLRGVDTELFCQEGPILPEIEQADWPRPYFMNVGRVAIEKNLTEFLKLDLPGTKIVVGQGPDQEKLKKAYPDVKFLGAKQGQELAAAYRAADVFVFPSKTDTFGLVIIEALASGVPVAAYPVTGPKDIVTDPMVGALRNDLKQACVESLAKDASACRSHAQKFSWDACTSRFRNALITLEGQRL